MALIGVRWLLQSVLAMGTAIIQAVQGASPWIHKYPRARNHLRILRRRQRHFNYINAKQRCIRILVWCFTRAPGQLFVLTDKRGAGYIDVDIVLIIRIDDQRMRVRAAASLHRGHLLRILDVGNIENSHAAETIFLRWRWRRVFLLSS